MKHNLILYTLLSIIILLLGYLVLKKPVSDYLNRKKIADNANILHVPEVYVVCYESLASENYNSSQDCIDIVKSFREKKNKWEDMIRSGADISCADFATGWDAFEFYNYVGGEYINFINVEDSSPKAYMTSNTICKNDPFNLDTDGDCTPCEQLNNKD